jgi:haloalkane dehalogenase
MEADISAEFPFDSRFVTVHGSSMHYVESVSEIQLSSITATPPLHIFGAINSTSFAAGRCIAPGPIGMGRSGKRQPPRSYPHRGAFRARRLE